MVDHIKAFVVLGRASVKHTVEERGAAIGIDAQCAVG